MQEEYQDELKRISEALQNIEERLSRLEQAYGERPAAAGEQTVPEKKPVRRTFPEWKPSLPKHMAFSEFHVGKYGIGILASLLVILAVAMFTANYWEHIPDLMKLGGILILGGSMLGVGAWQVKVKGKGGFWISLASCGNVVLYIGILSGSLVWYLYTEYVVTVLMFLWYVLSMSVSRVLRSSVFYVIAYIGALVSVGLTAWNIGFKALTAPVHGMEYLLLIAVVIWTALSESSRFLRLKLNEKFGIETLVRCLFALSLYGLLHEFLQHYEPRQAIWFWLTGVVLSLIVLAEALSLRMFHTKAMIGIKLILVHIAGYGLLLALNFMLYEHPHQDILSSGVYLSFLFLLWLLNRKDNWVLFPGSIIWSSIVLTQLSYGLLGTYVVLPALFGMLLWLMGERYFHPAANQVMALFLLFAGTFRYMDVDGGPGNILSITKISLEWLLIAASAAVGYVKSIPDSEKWFNSATQMLCLAAVSLSAAAWFMEMDFGSEPCLCLVTALVILHRLQMMKRRSYIHKAEGTLDRCCYIAWIGILHIMAYINSLFVDGIPEAFCIALVLNALSAASIYSSLKSDNMFTLMLSLLLCNINLFVSAGTFHDRYLYLLVSVIGIAVSVGLVVLGFVLKHKKLRIFSLVITILYVLKMVLIDVSSLAGGSFNTLMMLSGGVLCFVISFIYTRLEKVYGNEGEPENSR